MLNDVETAHAQSLRHDISKVSCLLRLFPDLTSEQLTENHEDDNQHHHQTDDEEHVSGRVVVDALRVEPLVSDHLQLAFLHHAGKLLVNVVDQFLVRTREVQFTGGDVHVAGPHIVERHLLNLLPQWHAAPQVVLDLAVRKCHQGIVGILVSDMIRTELLLVQVYGRIVVVLDHDGVLAGQLFQRAQWRGVIAIGHLNLIERHEVLRLYIRWLVIDHVQGMNHVGLPAFKSLDRLGPVAHLEAVGYLQLVEDGIHHLHAVARGRAILVELVGRETPVAHHHQRVGLRIRTSVPALRCCCHGGER